MCRGHSNQVISSLQIQAPLTLTWHRGAKRHKNNSRDRVLEANGAAEVGGQVPDDRCEHADDENGDDEAGPAMAILCGGHAGKQHLPEDR